MTLRRRRSTKTTVRHTSRGCDRGLPSEIGWCWDRIPETTWSDASVSRIVPSSGSRMGAELNLRFKGAFFGCSSLLNGPSCNIKRCL